MKTCKTSQMAPPARRGSLFVRFTLNRLSSKGKVQREVARFYTNIIRLRDSRRLEEEEEEEEEEEIMYLSSLESKGLYKTG